MDKGVKEILKTLSIQIDNSDLSSAIAADNFELSEEAIEDIVGKTKSLLTKEGAKHDKDIAEYYANDLYPKHKKSATSYIEQQLKPILDKLGVDYTKNEYISDAIPDLANKIEDIYSGKVNGKQNDLVESLKKDLEEANKQLQEKDSEFTKKLEETESAFKTQSLKKEFILKANNYTWADVYNDPDIKDSILEKKWNELNAKAHLTLSDDGEIQVFQKDMPDKELYEGNTKLTFQNLLEPGIEKYLKKSSPSSEAKKEVKDESLTPQQKANREAIMAARKKFQESER